jgi:transketolase
MTRPTASRTDQALAAAAQRVRRRIVEMAATPEGAHLGGALSATDVLTVLYCDVMRLRPEEPGWPGRDHFILSKGHAAAALYAVLVERGFLPETELAGYAQAGSRLGGHPSRAVPGVEFATGSLGHGLSLGVGLSLAAQRDGRDNRTYVLMGDGELQEGSVWEAATSAACLELDQLVAVVDCNRLQISGRTDRRTGMHLLPTRWAGFGWQVVEVDGHDHAALRRELGARPTDGRPKVVLAHTVKGSGVSFLEDRKKSHYAALSPRMRAQALAQLVPRRGEVR